ncbi:g12415 [Coccomyxa viridis]|uniref:G12415 protein n=1 Tax=Coccomyxa viridis TaxID=1274662 RepID=A0ABP1GCZ3_9CHLO
MHIVRALSSASPRLTSDGGGGSGDVPKDLRWAGEEEPEDDGSAERENILAKDGTAFEELPKDLQEALQGGAMSAAELRQWLALAARPILGALSRWFPAFRDRLMGNPRFLLVLAIEEIIGCTAKTIAEYQARGKDFWKEIDFVMSDLSLEIIGDFAIVWLLSPKKSFSAAPSGGLSLFASRLPGHSLQVGAFPLRYRLASIVLRGSQFFAVGCFASVLGHSLTIHLAEKRRQKLVKGKALKQKAGSPRLLPALPLDEEPEKELAPVARNSICWGTFMATSCNARYQLLNGLEERYLARLIPNKSLSTAVSALMRFGNTIVGSAQWIFIARQLGLQ